MPVVGRGDEAGVNVLSRQQFAEVSISGAILILVGLVHQVARLLELLLFHVAHGDDLGVRLRKKVPHVAGALRAVADAAHGDPVAGRRLPFRAENGGGHNAGKDRTGQGCTGRALDKETSSETCCWGCFHDWMFVQEVHGCEFSHCWPRCLMASGDFSLG